MDGIMEVNSEAIRPTLEWWRRHLSRRELLIAALVVIGYVLILIFYLLIAGRNDTKSDAVNALEQSFQSSESPTTPVVPSANPAADAVPEVNPLESTNPFEGKTYENPFE